MNYDWFQIFNLTDFLATGLVQRKFTPVLEGRGQVTIYVTRGNVVSVQIQDAFLPVSFLERNPYVQGAYAVYQDASANVWLGFEVSE